jgi:DNA-binding transcriptional ArsR family regulator
LTLNNGVNYNTFIPIWNTDRTDVQIVVQVLLLLPAEALLPISAITKNTSSGGILMKKPSDPGQSPPEAAGSRSSSPEESPQPLQITPEQNKLLESALRIKIMHALAAEPLTSKQVAEKLNKTPGNIHYHIIKLYEGGLLELVRTEAAGGIIQKFYRSKGTMFRSEQLSSFQFRKEDQIEHFITRLTLSPPELQQFQQDMLKLITAWESKATAGDEYGVEILVGRLQHADSAAGPDTEAEVQP